MPYDVLIKEFNSLFCKPRCAAEAYGSVQNAPVLVQNDFCQPVYELFMRRSCCARMHQCSGLPHRSALARGVVRRSLDWPVQGFLDLKKRGRAA